MSTDWTPPTEAVEAAEDAMFPRWPKSGDYRVAWRPHLTAALTAAYPAVVAEKDAEIERLRTEVEQVRRYVDRWKQEAASLREKLAAVAALADEWDGTPGDRFVWRLLEPLRAVLADRTEAS